MLLLVRFDVDQDIRDPVEAMLDAILHFSGDLVGGGPRGRVLVLPVLCRVTRGVRARRAACVRGACTRS